MKKIILFLVALCFTLSSCEKDDICDPATSTTPNLIVTFYDAASPTTTKNVTSLAIVDAVTSNIYGTFSSISKIKVPLNPMSTVAKYKFILNYGNLDPTLVYEAQLEFNYSTQNRYVSRACGFKTIYELEDNTPTLTPATTANWIQQLNVETTSITDENTTHIKIYF